MTPEQFLLFLAMLLLSALTIYINKHTTSHFLKQFSLGSVITLLALELYYIGWMIQPIFTTNP